MNYKALLFDLDDTLLDFQTSEHVALEKTYERFFPVIDDKAEFHETYKVINRTLWDMVEHGTKKPEEVKVERFQELIEAFELQMDALPIAQYYESWLGEAAHWLPGVKESLEQLRKRYLIGVVTNGLTNVQEKKAKLSGLNDWCHCFVISEKVGVSKPDRRIFEIALESLRLTPREVLMVGDSLSSDYLGAQNAKLDFCWVNPRQRKLPEIYAPPKYTITTVAALPEEL